MFFGKRVLGCRSRIDILYNRLWISKTVYSRRTSQTVGRYFEACRKVFIWSVTSCDSLLVVNEHLDLRVFKEQKYPSKCIIASLNTRSTGASSK